MRNLYWGISIKMGYWRATLILDPEGASMRNLYWGTSIKMGYWGAASILDTEGEA
jgi:hypothetical protein